MKDTNGLIVHAEVGDTVAAYCYLWKGVRVGKIERIKNGFRACGLKITPKAKKCVFISKSNKKRPRITKYELKRS
jgi:hypothetical protein